MVHISIIIPAYNASNYIHGTITSLLGYHRSDYEILIIDDGSTDDTNRIVEEIQAANLKCSIRYIFQENRGVSSARNRGFFEARGRYVAFIDADDIVTIDSLYEKAKYLEENNENIGVVSDALVFTSIICDNEGRLRGLNTLDQILEGTEGLITCPSGYLWVTSTLRRSGFLFNERLQSTADKEYLMQILLKFKIAWMQNARYHYRISDTSMSNLVTPKLITEKLVFAKHARELLERFDRKESAFISAQYYAAAGMAFSLNQTLKATTLLLRSFITSPSKCFQLLQSRKSGV